MRKTKSYKTLYSQAKNEINELRAMIRELDSGDLNKVEIIDDEEEDDQPSFDPFLNLKDRAILIVYL